MLPSMRRVASAAPPPVFPRAAILSGRPRQRRYSSSKPSNPDNGSSEIAAGQSVPASADKKPKAAGERRKRKAKGSPENRLPVVPSTQHLSQDALGLSTFFSLHRPISVTHSFPKTVSKDAFAAIFAPATRGAKPTDVISTLSHAVDQLEQPMAKLSLDGQRAQHESSADLSDDAATRIDLKHPDGSESPAYVQLNTMSGQFLPFRPPPAPQPRSSPQTSETASSETSSESNPSHRVYKAILTFEETTDADGRVNVVTHSPELIEDDSQTRPRTFLERMALRQLRHEDVVRRRQQQEGGMLAISVRRQKKLKMKKKKFKKLMRRTRNLRRKLDRI